MRVHALLSFDIAAVLGGGCQSTHPKRARGYPSLQNVGSSRTHTHTQHTTRSPSTEAVILSDNQLTGNLPPSVGTYAQVRVCVCWVGEGGERGGSDLVLSIKEQGDGARRVPHFAPVKRILAAARASSPPIITPC